jgi:Cu+-exporting ATPase
MVMPLATIGGEGMAVGQGILTKSSEAFHAFKDLEKIVRDKTGTITTGKPRVVRVEPFGGYPVNEVPLLAESMEKQSEHPLVKAIVQRVIDAVFRARGLPALS